MKKSFLVSVIAVACLIIAGAAFYRFSGQGRPAPTTSPVLSENGNVPARPRAPTSVGWKTAEPRPRQTPPPNPNLVLPPTFDERFKETLSFKETQSSPLWAYGKVGKFPVFRDAKTGLIWGPRLKFTTNTLDAPNVVAGMKACAELDPAGGWALPTAAEFEAARANGLLKIDRDGKHPWLTYLTGRKYIVSAARLWLPSDKKEPFAVRCVGHDKL